MKKTIVRRIKWENIISIIMIVLTIASTIEHIKLNGIYVDLLLELFIYSMFTIVMNYVIKDIRTNKKSF